jgi:hypothetical protein
MYFLEELGMNFASPWWRCRQVHDAAEHNPTRNQINLRHVLDIVKKWDEGRIKVDRRGRRIDSGSSSVHTTLALLKLIYRTSARRDRDMEIGEGGGIS